MARRNQIQNTMNSRKGKIEKTHIPHPGPLGTELISTPSPPMRSERSAPTPGGSLVTNSTISASSTVIVFFSSPWTVCSPRKVTASTFWFSSWRRSSV